MKSAIFFASHSVSSQTKLWVQELSHETRVPFELSPAWVLEMFQSTPSSCFFCWHSLLPSRRPRLEHDFLLGSTAAVTTRSGMSPRISPTI